jgi:hypothetical protein
MSIYVYYHIWFMTLVARTIVVEILTMFMFMLIILINLPFDAGIMVTLGIVYPNYRLREEVANQNFQSN